MPLQQFAIAKSILCCGFFISFEWALIYHYHCNKKKMDPPPHVADYARCYTQKVKESTLRPIRALSYRWIRSQVRLWYDHSWLKNPDWIFWHKCYCFMLIQSSFSTTTTTTKMKRSANVRVFFIRLRQPLYLIFFHIIQTAFPI